MIIVCFVMMIYIFLMIGIKSFDTHTSRLIFFNLYLAFPVLLYNIWYAFAIFNDWWISVPYVICRDTKNNPPRPNSPEFDDCVQVIKDHTSTDLVINISFGLYLAYYFKKWADQKKDEEYDKTTEPVVSDEKCFICVPLETGVKAIALFCIFKPPIVAGMALYTGKAPKEIVIPLLMVELTASIFFILVLGIKDNNTLWGRRMMFAGFVVFNIIVAITMIYSMIYDEQTWGTTLPKVLCKGSTESDCQTKQE